jgi:hypothetical protein
MAQNGLTSFVPSKHGFHFCNAFTNNVISSATANALLQSLGLPALFPPGMSSNLWTTGGRCGGMAWLSLDYYFASENVPTAISSYSSFHRTFDDFASTGEVPPDGTPLADWIYKRLFDTFLNCGLQTLAWVAGYDHNTWFFGGVPEMTTSNEFPKLQSAIDSGTPVVLSVISWPSNASTCHQVVAYGYQVDDQGNMSVNIYDNRYADDDTVTMSAAPNQHWTIASSDARVQPDTWKGWFVEGYSAETPPFVDVAISSQIAGPESVANGQSANYTFTVTNVGKYPAHPTAFRLVGATDFGEQFVLGPMMWPPSNLMPGTSVDVTVPLLQINWPEGVTSSQVVLQAQFQTLEAWWDPLGTSPGVANTLTITMVPGISAYINVVSTALSVDVVNGVKTAVALVSCSATSTGFAQTPTFAWSVDGVDDVATGSTATLRVLCGTTGSISRAHTISATATGPTSAGTTTSVTTAVQLTINPMTVRLTANYSNSTVASGALEMRLPVGGGGGGGGNITRYSQVEVDAACTGGFGSVAYSWQPATVTQTVPGVAMVPAGDLESELVTVTATDEMYEAAAASLLVQFVVDSARPALNSLPTNSWKNAASMRVKITTATAAQPSSIGNFGRQFTGALGVDPIGQILDARTLAAPVAIEQDRALAVVSAPKQIRVIQGVQQTGITPAPKSVPGNGRLVTTTKKLRNPR